MAWPHEGTDWDYMLAEVQQCYMGMLAAFTSAGCRVLLLAPQDSGVESRIMEKLEFSDRVRVVAVDTNDTWTRDYGPLAVSRYSRHRLLDFGFNGWGLKFASDRDNLANLRLEERGVWIKGQLRNERDFVLEGGSVETDGHGTVLTTTRCLTSPNRNGGKSKGELNEILAARLGADHVLWLDYGALIGDDTDSHIDTLARMAPGDTILFTSCSDMDDPQFEELLHMHAQLTLFRTPEGNPYNLVALPLPDAIYDEDGQRLPATYANYLVCNGHIFMPTYGQPQKDTLACHTVRVAFPNHEVVPVDCRALIKQHGSLHCATMQLPKGFYE